MSEFDFDGVEELLTLADVKPNIVSWATHENNLSADDIGNHIMQCITDESFITKKWNLTVNDDELTFFDDRCIPLGYIYTNEGLDGDCIDNIGRKEYVIIYDPRYRDDDEKTLNFVLRETSTNKGLLMKSSSVSVAYPHAVNNKMTYGIWVAECMDRLEGYTRYHKSMKNAHRYVSKMATMAFAGSKGGKDGFKNVGFSVDVYCDSMNIMCEKVKDILNKGCFVMSAIDISITSGATTTWDDNAFTNRFFTHARTAHDDAKHAPSDTQVGGESIKVSKPIPAIHLDKRLPIKLKIKADSDFYINQFRCIECGQRVIVSLSKEDMPPPTLKLKCPDCKKKGIIVE